MALRKIKDKWYIDIYSNNKRIRKSLSVSKKADAIEIHDKLKRQIKEKRY